MLGLSVKRLRCPWWHSGPLFKESEHVCIALNVAYGMLCLCYVEQGCRCCGILSVGKYTETSQQQGHPLTATQVSLCSQHKSSYSPCTPCWALQASLASFPYTWCHVWWEDVDRKVASLNHWQ